MALLNPRTWKDSFVTRDQSWPNYAWDSPSVAATGRGRTFLKRDSHQAKVPRGQPKFLPLCHLYCLSVSTCLDSQAALHLVIRGSSRASCEHRECTMIPRLFASPVKLLPLSFCLNSWRPVTFHPTPATTPELMSSKNKGFQVWSKKHATDR